MIASLYAKIGEYRTALKYVSSYLKIKPSSFTAYKLQAECYEKLNRPSDALKSYQKALHSVERKRNSKQVDLDSSLDEIKENVSSEKTHVLKSPTAADTSAEEITATKNQRDMNEVTNTCNAKFLLIFNSLICMHDNRKLFNLGLFNTTSFSVVCMTLELIFSFFCFIKVALTWRCINTGTGCRRPNMFRDDIPIYGRSHFYAGLHCIFQKFCLSKFILENNCDAEKGPWSQSNVFFLLDV